MRHEVLEQARHDTLLQQAKRDALARLKQAVADTESALDFEAAFTQLADTMQHILDTAVASGKRHVWMCYEDHNTYAVPKKPRFMIRATAEEMDQLMSDLECLRIGVEDVTKLDTKFTYEGLPFFSSVDVYHATARAVAQRRIEVEISRRSAVSFFRQPHPPTP